MSYGPVTVEYGRGDGPTDGPRGWVYFCHIDQNVCVCWSRSTRCDPLIRKQVPSSLCQVFVDWALDATQSLYECTVRPVTT